MSEREGNPEMIETHYLVEAHNYDTCTDPATCEEVTHWERFEDEYMTEQDAIETAEKEADGPAARILVVARVKTLAFKNYQA